MRSDIGCIGERGRASSTYGGVAALGLHGLGPDGRFAEDTEQATHKALVGNSRHLPAPTPETTRSSSATHPACGRSVVNEPRGRYAEGIREDVYVVERDVPLPAFD